MRTEDRQTTAPPQVLPQIVTFPAEVDITNAPHYGSKLRAALRRPGVCVVIADLSPTEFCDSTGVRYMLIADDAARRQGAELRVVVTAPIVLRMMKVLGVDRVLQVYDSLEDALSASLDQAGAQARIPVRSRTASAGPGRYRGAPWK